MLDELVKKRDELFRRVQDELGLTMKQTSGDRTEEQETAIYAGGQNVNEGDRRPRHSGHLVGCAFDAEWYDQTNDLWRYPGPKICTIARQVGLRCGWDFKNSDAVHFDLGYERIMAEWKVKEAA
jgi:hypothetical protein